MLQLHFIEIQDPVFQRTIGFVFQRIFILQTRICFQAFINVHVVSEVLYPVKPWTYVLTVKSYDSFGVDRFIVPTVIIIQHGLPIDKVRFFKQFFFHLANRWLPKPPLCRRFLLVIGKLCIFIISFRKSSQFQKIHALR